MKIINTERNTQLWHSARRVGIILIACIAFGVPVLGVLTGHLHHWSEWSDGLDAFLGNISNLGAPGLIVVVLLMVLIACTGVLPASLIGVASGSVYGLWGGFLLSTFATLVGAWVSFAVSRSFLRDAFSRLFVRRPRMRQLGTEVAKHGWRFVCLLRMSPIMPFAITSYALGLSPIGTRDYTVGTVAALPALFGYVCMGWLARSAIGPRSTSVNSLEWAIAGVGIAATVALTLYMKRILTAADGRNRDL